MNISFKSKVKIASILVICFLLCAFLSACGKEKSFDEQLYEKLSNLASVVEVNKLEQQNPDFDNQYEVFFEMPLDWNDPDGETFKQRVIVDGKSFDKSTVVELQGYNIGDKYIDKGFVRELPNLLDSNFVVIEHRFFGKSSYKGANYNDAKGWEQLTVKNAAHDHNFIISELRKVFPKKWVASGSSKGGYITNCLACLYPETCDVYVPYVAPCATEYDPRAFEFVYNEAGNSTYGPEEAKNIRDNITRFQIFCYEHKQEMIPILFSEEHFPSDLKLRPALTKENYYDIDILDFAYGLWQYQNIPMSDIADFLFLPANTEEELAAKINVAVDLIIKSGADMSNISYTGDTFPYNITARKEMGNYAYDFSYVKAMAKAEGKEISISIPEGQEREYSDKVSLSEEQLEKIKYDSTMFNTLTNWIKDSSVKTKIIMINGQEDPWYHISLPIPEKIGENIKVYTHPSKNHRVQITDFEENTQKEIMDYLTRWVK